MIKQTLFPQFSSEAILLYMQWDWRKRTYVCGQTIISGVESLNLTHTLTKTLASPPLRSTVGVVAQFLCTEHQEGHNCAQFYDSFTRKVLRSELKAYVN